MELQSAELIYLNNSFKIQTIEQNSKEQQWLN